MYACKTSQHVSSTTSGNSKIHASTGIQYIIHKSDCRSALLIGKLGRL